MTYNVFGGTLSLTQSINQSYYFTEFTEAVNENTGSLSKHRLSPYNAHYLN